MLNIDWRQSLVIKLELRACKVKKNVVPPDSLF